jgi:hypothetical protein
VAGPSAPPNTDISGRKHREKRQQIFRKMLETNLAFENVAPVVTVRDGSSRYTFETLKAMEDYCKKAVVRWHHIKASGCRHQINTSVFNV